MTKKNITIVSLAVMGLFLVPLVSDAQIIYNNFGVSSSGTIQINPFGVNPGDDQIGIATGTLPVSITVGDTLYGKVLINPASSTGGGSVIISNATAPYNIIVANFPNNSSSSQYVSFTATSTQTLSVGAPYFLSYFGHYYFGASTSSITSALPIFSWGTEPFINGTADLCIGTSPGDCSVNPSVPSLALLYPINGITTPPFQAYIASTTPSLNPNFGFIWWATSLNGSDLRFATSGAIGSHISGCLTGNCGSMSVAGSAIFASNTIQYIVPAQPLNGLGVDTSLGTSSLVYEQGVLTDQLSNVLAITPTSSFRYFYATSTFLNNNYTVYAGQGPVAGSPLPSYSTSTVGGICPAPDNILDVGGGIVYGGCFVANYLFGNTGYSLNALQQYWNSFLTIPPFNLVFGTEALVEGGVSSSGNGSTTLSFSMPIGSVSVLSFNLLTPTIITDALTTDTCNSSCAISLWSGIYADLVDVGWVLTSVIAIGMVI